MPNKTIEEKSASVLMFSRNPQIDNYIQASLAGAAKGLVGLPLEHPFDYIKTRWQSAPQTTSSFDIISDTYRTKGIKGFYAGAVPNATRVAIKQAYRWPLMLALPPFFQKSFFKDKNDHVVLQQGLTGLTIASLETFIITPLEKCKVWLMTNAKKEKTLKDMFLDSNSPIKTAFKALNIVYPRQIVAWSSFLMTDEALKVLARKNNNNEKLSYKTLLAISGVVGVVNTLTTMPFDMVKTLVQKDDPWENKGVVKTMQKAYQTFGVRGLYVGWQIRLIQYSLQSLVTVNLLDKFKAASYKATQQLEGSEQHARNKPRL